MAQENDRPVESSAASPFHPLADVSSAQLSRSEKLRPIAEQKSQKNRGCRLAPVAAIDCVCVPSYTSSILRHKRL